MSKSFLEEVTAEVIRWQNTGEEPDLEPARAIVAQMRGVGVFEIRVRIEIGHQSHIGGKPVKFDHTQVPGNSKVAEAVHHVLETINDATSLKVDLDAGIDVEVKRLS